MLRGLRLGLFVALLALGAGRALAHPGWGIVVDDGGSVFYTDLEQIWRITPDGAKAIVVPGVHSHELYLDPAGTLHGEHLWYDNATSKWGHYDWEYANGKLARKPAREGLRVDDGFVRDAQGNRYWLEASRIRVRAPDGRTRDLAEVPRPPDAPGEAPGGVLALGADGALYLIDGGDLLRVGLDGRVVRRATGLNEHVWTAFMTQPWHYVMGLASDASGNVYVANAGARKVKRVAPDGTVSVVLKSRYPWSPTGIALHRGDLYVLEYTDTGGSVRVRRVGADGRVTALP